MRPHASGNARRVRLYRRLSARLPESLKRLARGSKKRQRAVRQRLHRAFDDSVVAFATTAPRVAEPTLSVLTRWDRARASAWLARAVAAPSEPDSVRAAWLRHAVRRNPYLADAHALRIRLLRSVSPTEARTATLEAELLLATPIDTGSPAGAAAGEYEESATERAAVLRSLVEESPKLAARAAGAAVRSGDTARLLEVAAALEAAGGPAIDPLEMLQLCTALYQHGQIARPLRLLDLYGEDRWSARLRALHWRLSVDHEVLESGVAVRPPNVRPIGAPDPRSTLYLLHNSLPHQAGGYATRTHGLLSALNRAGHHVHGVTRPGFPATTGTFDQRRGIPDCDTVDGVSYRRLIGTVTALPRSDLDGFVQLYADMLAPLLDEFRPHVLHAASNWWNGAAATAIARSAGIASIYEVRGLWEVTRASRIDNWEGTDMYRLDARYEADVAKEADRVIAITTGLRDELVARGVEPSKITIVPNAVDAQRFTRRPPDVALRRELDLDDAVVIGFVGSMTFYEGLDDLIHAAATIRAGSSTPFRLLFVGDGPVRTDLEQLAAELGVASICRFVGRVPHEEVQRYFSLIDITPFPRLPLPVCEMVSPLKPLESMASGIPVLVSSVAALRDMVEDGAHGAVFEKGDRDDLAAKLGALIDDPAARVELADAAEEWVRRERSWDSIARRVTALYEELAG